MFRRVNRVTFSSPRNTTACYMRHLFTYSSPQDSREALPRDPQVEAQAISFLIP